MYRCSSPLSLFLYGMILIHSELDVQQEVSQEGQTAASQLRRSRAASSSVYKQLFSGYAALCLTNILPQCMAGPWLSKVRKETKEKIEKIICQIEKKKALAEFEPAIYSPFHSIGMF